MYGGLSGLQTKIKHGDVDQWGRSGKIMILREGGQRHPLIEGGGGAIDSTPPLIYIPDQYLTAY